MTKEHIITYCKSLHNNKLYPNTICPPPSQIISGNLDYPNQNGNFKITAENAQH